MVSCYQCAVEFGQVRRPGVSQCGAQGWGYMAGLNVFQWLRYGPWLAQVVVTRRCNLKCGYCTEYDRTSDPVPYEELALRLAKLAELRAWAVCLTGGEPTMHPRLPDLVAEMKRLGFKRRMMITNGWRLTPALIDALNGAGLTDMQISVDGVNPTKVTAKTLKPLRKKLELLAEKATFRGGHERRHRERAGGRGSRGRGLREGPRLHATHSAGS